MVLKRVLKGGNFEMEINGKIYLEICKYCNREFKSLYPAQAINNKNIHEMNCLANPSNKDNVNKQ